MSLADNGVSSVAMTSIVRVTLLLLLGSVHDVMAHGRLLAPPSRSSMWRDGHKNPTNYNDNQLFCGGSWIQWGVNNGKCGVCGDAWNGVRENEAGGKYANGIITQTYGKGGVVEVGVEITANHKGWFEFRLCPHNDPATPITEQCLNDNLLPLAEAVTLAGFTSDVGETRIKIGTTNGMIDLKMQLPADVTCTQCVLQWKYNTGNSWGMDPVTGESGLGLGSQEQFYGCSDVAITSSGAPPPPSPLSDSSAADDEVLTVIPSTPSGSCHAGGLYEGMATIDAWCATNCALGSCPATHCVCDVLDDGPSVLAVGAIAPGDPYEWCRPIPMWLKVPKMDAWCFTNCRNDYCPESHCTCDPPDEILYGAPDIPDVILNDDAAAPCEKYYAIGGEALGNEYADAYCQLTCSLGVCPGTLCQCGPGGAVQACQGDPSKSVACALASELGGQTEACNVC